MKPRTNAKGLEKLKRIDVRVPAAFPLNSTSFAPSLYIHYRTICVSGQVNIARSLLGLLHIIDKKMKHLAVPLECSDDYVRQHLKHISSDSFIQTFKASPAYMYFVHLHALGGKVPYKREEIEADIEAWVRDDKEFFNPDFVKQRIDHLFGMWNANMDDGLYLTFREYCKDIMRWGTSGGARKSEFRGEEYRTKWAWGLSRLTDNSGTHLREDVDLYQEALAQGEDAKVALKEEATKTRPVITTSMASYLRQSYLAYRWGKPHFNSPIASSTWLPLFQSNPYSWYGCLDGDRFDQTVPGWVIKYIIAKLGQLGAECPGVARMELDALDNLQVTWGDKKWKWHGGLLSGWRLTSLIGSIVSCVVAEWIIMGSSTPGAFSYGVMGDDLILYSHTSSMTPQYMTDAYNAFGLKANLHKTTSGRIGEYLRKTYSPRGVLGYPCLALRTCIYANPWITNYDQEFEEEIANGWLTYYSRMLPLRTDEKLHGFIFNLIISNIEAKSKFKHLNWRNWLQTPISAGGGGPAEWSNPSVWSIVKRDRTQDKQTDFFGAIGLIKTTPLMHRVDTMKKLNYDWLQQRVKQMTSNPLSYPRPKINKNVNITFTLYDWFVNDEYAATEIEKLLGYPLPRGLRAAGKNAILDYILGQDKSKTGISSVQTTKEMASLQNRVVKFVTRSLAVSKIMNGVRNLGAAATIYAGKINAGRDVVYGTW